MCSPALHEINVSFGAHFRVSAYADEVSSRSDLVAVVKLPERYEEGYGGED